MTLVDGFAMGDLHNLRSHGFIVPSYPPFSKAKNVLWMKGLASQRHYCKKLRAPCN